MNNAPFVRYRVQAHTWRAPFRWLHPLRSRNLYSICIYRTEDGSRGMTQSHGCTSDAVHMALDYIECQWGEEVSVWQVSWDWSGIK